MIKHRAPDMRSLAVKPALGEAEVEEGNERRIRKWLEEVVRGGEEQRREKRQDGIGKGEEGRAGLEEFLR